MPNPYFQFKQFTVYQDQCAMKVCTDACVLGAWFSHKAPSYARMLDIGCGTGLLMLMLAQRNKGEIRGIELDLPAFRQSKENIERSPWKDMLKAVPGDIRSYRFHERFDFIISNPPFFEGDLEASSQPANLAKHSHALSFPELLDAVDRNLKTGGSFGVLLPHQRSSYFESLANAGGFHLRERLALRQTPDHPLFRSILHFSRHKENFVAEAELTISRGSGGYTDEFLELMRDYYLYL